MKTTVESKKLHLIEEFLKIQNEETIHKIEVIIRQERFKVLKGELDTAISEMELNEMIDRAENYAIQGKVTNSKGVKKQIESWK